MKTVASKIAFVSASLLLAADLAKADVNYDDPNLARSRGSASEASFSCAGDDLRTCFQAKANFGGPDIENVMVAVRAAKGGDLAEKEVLIFPSERQPSSTGSVYRPLEDVR